MSRLDYVTIAIVVICLVALGFLVYKTVGLMTTDLPEDTTSVEDSYNLGSDENTDDAYDYEEEGDSSVQSSGDQDLDDDEVGYVDDGTYNPDEENKPSTAEDDSYSEPEEDTPATITKKETETYGETTASTPASSSSGNYLVVAGSFRVRSNADQRVKELRKLGYTSAEVAILNSGAFAIALVDRFDSESEARELVSDLKSKGMSAFVKKREAN